MIPVLFVLAVTAVKDLYEDRRRYLSDRKVNHSTCRVFNAYGFPLRFISYWRAEIINEPYIVGKNAGT